MELAKLAQFHKIDAIAASQVEDSCSVLQVGREDLKDGGTAELKVTSLTITSGERIEEFLNIAAMANVRAHRGIRILAGHCSTTAPFCQPLFRGPRSSFKHLA